MADVKTMEIRDTPSFFVNGQPLTEFGPQQLYELEAPGRTKQKEPIGARRGAKRRIVAHLPTSAGAAGNGWSWPFSDSGNVCSSAAKRTPDGQCRAEAAQQWQTATAAA